MNKALNIAFDIDGVLNDIENFQLEYGVVFFRALFIKNYYKKYGVKIKKSDVKDTDLIANENGYGIKEVFGCTSIEEVKFWKKNILKFFFKSARADIKDTIRSLRLDGNKIFIISSRALTTDKSMNGKIMRFLVTTWLKKNGIKYDKIIFCSVKNSDKNKAKECIKNKIDIMVEDNKQNIESISKITRTICFNTRNNKGLLYGDNIHFANNFEEVYLKIKHIKEEIIDTKTSSFKLLTKDERSELSRIEIIDYYRGLKDYYLSLPFDKDELAKHEIQCVRVMNILQPVFNKFYTPKTINKELFPDNSGIILACNHLHSFDPLIILSSVTKRPFCLLAKSELLEQNIGILFNYIGSVFVDNTDEESRKNAKDMLIKILLHGGTIMKFPEGTRNRTDKFLLDFYYGTVDIAQKTGAPIIPFAINDNYKFRSKTLMAKIGRPLYIKPDDDLTKMNVKLRDTIATLLWDLMEEEFSRKNSNNLKSFIISKFNTMNNIRNDK